jgi:hypothetical protein
MLFTEGMFLRHHVYFARIKVDTIKTEAIINLPVPKTQNNMRSVSGHTGYYNHFIDFFLK